MASRTQKSASGNQTRTNATKDPSLRLERRLLRAHSTLVAIDECGRGSLSGPVFCGAVYIDSSVTRPPVGVRDSKLLSAKRREELLPRVQEWSCSSATGAASAKEIDRFGILYALRLAALRAIAALDLSSVPGVILLDGPLDWISPESARAEHHFDTLTGLRFPIPPVVTKVKGDRECTSLAAASILAKVRRDSLMQDLDRRHPGYGWSANKGYASPTHVEGLRRLGPSPQHRRSWHLPGVEF
jgi:ribonuclease HII